MEAIAATSLSEIAADFVRLWNQNKSQHEEVREMFVHQDAVVEPQEVHAQIGDEVDVDLQYPNPTNEQVPGLKGLLEYVD